MSEIKLSKRIKYASDVYNMLIEGGFDEENAILFLEGIPDANVASVVYGAVDTSWRRRVVLL